MPVHCFQAHPGDRRKLTGLLTAIQKIGNSCPLIRDITDSGELFQPLAFTSREAVEFLNNVPLFESRGHQPGRGLPYPDGQ